MRSVVDSWGFTIAKQRAGGGNEDYAEFQPKPGADTPDWADFAVVVADGVGSSDSPADAAATTARSWLLHARSKFLENGAACANFAELHFNEITSHAFLQAHEAVQQGSKGSACAAAACLQGDLLLVGNVGDCRAYRISARGIQQLSKDQVDSQGDPTDVVGGRRTPRAITSAKARVQAGDAVLLCTDGVWKHLTAEELGAAATGGSAKEIAQKIQRLLESRRKPESDDATLIVALIKRIGRPFWEADTEPMETRPKDDSTDTKINGVLVELLNRLRTPLESQSAKGEQVMEQMSAAARDLRTATRELEEVVAEISGTVKRTGGRRRSSGPNGAFLAVAVGAVIVFALLGWAVGSRRPAVKSYELKPVLPAAAQVVSQSYTDDRLLVKFRNEDDRLMMGVYRVEDGGKPYAIIDLTTGSETKPVAKPKSTGTPTPTTGPGE